jgi:5-methylcytosine-specific restriction protein B
MKSIEQIQHDERVVTEAAQTVIDAGLRRDDSALTPGAPVWSPDNARELAEHLGTDPDNWRGGVPAFLQQRLSGSSPGVVQLAVELLYLNLLPVDDITADRKRAQLKAASALRPEPVSIPLPLDRALEFGAWSGGMGAKMWQWRQMQFLSVFVDRFKSLPTSEREQLIDYPRSFRDFVFEVPGQSADMERHALCWLAFPDAFEPIVSSKHKKAIREAFKDEVPKLTDDIDEDLLSIRRALERRTGGRISFYRPPWIDRWRPGAGSVAPGTPSKRAWLVRGSSVGGVNLVPTWLEQGIVSLAATNLREVEPGSERGEIEAIVEEDYQHVSYTRAGRRSMSSTYSSPGCKSGTWCSRRRAA